MNNQLTFTDILNAQTVEDLKKLGQIKINGEKRALGPNGLRKIMQEYLSINTLSLKGKKQYESFFQFLQKLKTLSSPVYPKLDDDTISLSMQPENKLIENKSDEYFISDTSKYIYALVELDGEKRIKALGIKSEFYYDKEKAKAWRNNISKIIHPDTHSHPKATEAHARLNKLYESMIG